MIPTNRFITAAFVVALSGCLPTGRAQALLQWDSLELRIELATQTQNLQAPSADDGDVWAWTEIVLYHGAYATWMEHKERAETLLSEEHLEASLPAPYLRWLYGPWRHEWSRFQLGAYHPDWSEDTTAFVYSRRFLLHDVHAQSSAFRPNAVEQLSTIAPPPPKRERLQVALFIASVALIVLNLFLRRQLKKTHHSMGSNSTPTSFKALEQLIETGEPSKASRTMIRAMHFDLFDGELKSQIKDASLLNRLTKKQQLLLFLILAGSSSEECAEHLGVSIGHIYNQRSSIRKILELDDTEAFETLLK